MARVVGLVFPEAVPIEEPESAEKFICPHCGKEYKTAEGLEKHIKDKHPDEEGTTPAPV